MTTISHARSMTVFPELQPQEDGMQVRTTLLDIRKRKQIQPMVGSWSSACAGQACRMSATRQGMCCARPVGGFRRLEKISASMLTRRFEETRHNGSTRHSGQVLPSGGSQG
jgi:hypothetical protein